MIFVVQQAISYQVIIISNSSNPILLKKGRHILTKNEHFFHKYGLKLFFVSLFRDMEFDEVHMK